MIGRWRMNTLYRQVDSYRRRWLAQNLDNYDLVLLLPSKDTDINIRISDAFWRRLKGRSGAVIEGDVAREIVRLYELYEFSGKVIIGSFDEPYGRKLRNLLNCGIAEDTLINDVILGAL